MVRPPRLNLPRRQRQLVAVLMAALLLASLGAAQLLGQWRRGQYETLQLDRLELLVPRAWQRDAEAERAMGITDARVMHNPVHPYQSLRLVPWPAHSPPPPQALLDRTMLPNERGHFQRFEPPPMARPVTRLAGVSLIGPEQPAVHLLTSVRVEERRWWLVHLIDRPRPGESPAAAMDRNGRLFRRIVGEGRLLSSTTQTPTLTQAYHSP